MADRSSGGRRASGRSGRSRQSRGGAAEPPRQSTRGSRSSSARSANTRSSGIRSANTRAANSRKPTGGRNGGPNGGEDLNDYTGIRGLMNPLWCYYGFRLAVLALTCFGVVMVFSSSSVTMISYGLSPWKQALTQGLYCVIGLLLGWGAMHIPVSLYRKFSLWVVGASILLQLVTLTPLGIEVNGNKGWIGIGGFTMQPAEFMKLALCIWMPASMANVAKRESKDRLKGYLVVAFVFLVCLGTVMLGGDLGTAIILLFIGAAAFVTGGFPWRWLFAIAALMAGAVAFFVLSSPNRMKRVLTFSQLCADPNSQPTCYQPTHSKYAMASGGLFGVGIGNSREKWNYLPEAHNDFIFAIIGEETGFVGAVIVLILFIALGWCMIVVAVKSADRYASMVLVCVAVWIVGQAAVNIMVVVDLLPVMGVPLPFVSAGGSSLVMCLIAAGVATSMMKEQPQIEANALALSL
ncbi:putative lipid II flippase FtsW [Bifidobacterium sp. ESL0790]|uniref:putative lipid II flippase FtsW n=1 Tax=Bifidobacterium sp. ESL0790 TaxID=2983233 RepID=UPI0023F68BEA|nr:putative lipid II flippase FtsW [Bifidobacterium sp. ESL0790]WEV72860.1 putative lipid II flippase FtsW [Bifidobacterium sp. ESL0790]